MDASMSGSRALQQSHTGRSRARRNHTRRSRGQSMLEFALLTTVLMSTFTFVLQVNSAISMAIVGRKYSRAQLHFLMFNHRYYLERKFSKKEDSSIRGWYFVGVSKDPHFDALKPRATAPTQKVGRNKIKSEDEPAQVEFEEGITTRHNVRIRPLTFTCLPPLGGNANQYFTDGSLGESTFAGGYSYCND